VIETLGQRRALALPEIVSVRETPQDRGDVVHSICQLRVDRLDVRPRHRHIEACTRFLDRAERVEVPRTHVALLGPATFGRVQRDRRKTASQLIAQRRIVLFDSFDDGPKRLQHEKNIGVDTQHRSSFCFRATAKAKPNRSERSGGQGSERSEDRRRRLDLDGREHRARIEIASERQISSFDEAAAEAEADAAAEAEADAAAAAATVTAAVSVVAEAVLRIEHS
jgi:hypothetical protein